MTTPTNEIATLSFEAAYSELENVLTQLEDGSLPLDDSVALFAYGQQLSAHCQTLLDQAELRVSQLDAPDAL